MDLKPEAIIVEAVRRLMEGGTSRGGACAVLRDDVASHPAVAAWRARAPGTPPPAGIEILHRGKRQSAAFRLLGAGNGVALIALKATPARAALERTVHERLLPDLALTAPRYYGALEADAGTVWLFFEDVGTERLSPLDASHRALAARWLAELHTGGATHQAAHDLPATGAGRFRETLVEGRAAIRAHLDNPVIGRLDRASLAGLADLLDGIEARWNDLETWCGDVPRTVTHGDVQRKNLYLRRGARGPELCPIDWETAARGTPAADLAWVDARTYWAAVRPRWSGVRLNDVRRLATAGRIFMAVADIGWAAPALAAQEWEALATPIAHLNVFRRRLAKALTDLESLR